MTHGYTSLKDRRLSLHAQAMRRPRRGFSLIELLVVVSIILILIALILPSLGRVRFAAWGVVCRSNLTQIYKAVSTKGKVDYKMVPSAGQWQDAVRTNGAQDALICPMGRYDEGSNIVASDAYFTQRPGPAPLGVIFSYLEDIKQGNFNDPQIGTQWKGNSTGDFGENGASWPAWAFERTYGRPLAHADLAITFNDDAGAVVTYSNSPVQVVGLDPPSGAGGQPDAGSPFSSGGDMACGSDHWFCIGESGAGWETEIQMQLTGNSYKNQIDQPVNLSGGSYGMNSLISDKAFRTGQLMFSDYKKAIIDILPDGNYIDDFDEWFAPRHEDKANILLVGGEVDQRSRSDLELDAEIWLSEEPPTLP